MSVTLIHDRYGKAEVRLLKLVRGAERHDVYEWTVAIRLEGDFESAHTRGDNSRVLPTDTMKNTVYALAAGTSARTPEAFGLELARHLASRNAQVRRVEVDLVERPWARLGSDGRPHPHAFVAAGEERRHAHVAIEHGAVRLEGGLGGLLLMKTAQSAFSGFPRDEFTTLPETRDRIFRTIVTARWTWAGDDSSVADSFGTVRHALVHTFAGHDSESVQHTLYAMGEAALAAVPAVQRIQLTLPNRHCLPVRLESFGLESRNEIFVVTDEPYGLIEATLARAPSPRS